MVDTSNLYSTLGEVRPDEMYSLVAQSHVGLSFKVPDYSSNVDGIGVLRFLPCIKDLQLKTKFYQASTSELFGGLPGPVAQNEETSFIPRSPYPTAKLFAYWVTRNYREGYNIFACNGILFNQGISKKG